MQEILKRAQAIFPATAILGACIAVTFYVTDWYSDVNHDRESFKTFMGEVRDDFKILRADIEGLRTDIEELKVSTEGLKTDNQKILSRLPGPTVQAGSRPLKLTRLGVEVARCIEPHKAALFASFADAKPTVQWWRDWNPSEDAMNKIRHCAYEHNTGWNQVMDVLDVQLRGKHSGEGGGGWE